MHSDSGDICKHQLNLAAEQRIDGRAIALVRHPHNIGARHRLEQFRAQMRGRAGRTGAVIQFAGLGFRHCNQFLDRVHGKRRVHHQNIGRIGCHDERRKILHWIVRHVGVQKGL